MGTAWSRWLESSSAFDKTRYIDADGQRVFYTSLKLAVAAIERSVKEEQADFRTNDPDEQTLAQLQYVLENWSREVGSLYDRVGDFPLILPIPNELNSLTASTENVNKAELLASAESLPQSPDELRLKAACCNKSSTSEEIYQMLQRVSSKLPDDELLRVLAKYPRAARLFCSQRIQARMDVGTPFKLMTSSKQYARAASLVGVLAYGEEAFVKKRHRLQEMSMLLQRAQVSPATSQKDRLASSFNQAMTDEMVTLIDTQNRLENQLGVMHLIGSSVVETIQKLVTLFPTHVTTLSYAASFAEQFHVHPTQFWYCLLRILPANEQWHTLFMLSAAVPPPFGVMAIAETLVEAQRTNLAPDLIAAIASAQERDEVARYLAANEPVDDQVPPADDDDEASNSDSPSIV